MKSSRLVAAIISLMILSAPAFASAADTDPSIQISMFRAVRISESTIALSFTTQQNTIGTVVYTTPDQGKVTLTDSQPQTDHLFTINDLMPSYGYTFMVSAEEGRIASNQYEILISPESIGGPGESMMPSVQMVAPDGTLLSSEQAASTTPVEARTISPWLFVGIAVFLGAGWIAFRRKPAFIPPSGQM